jgi:hypothetical protein
MSSPSDYQHTHNPPRNFPDGSADPDAADAELAQSHVQAAQRHHTNFLALVQREVSENGSTEPQVDGNTTKRLAVELVGLAEPVGRVEPGTSVAVAAGTVVGAAVVDSDLALDQGVSEVHAEHTVDASVGVIVAAVDGSTIAGQMEELPMCPQEIV